MKIERTKNAARSIMTGFVLKAYQMIAPFLMRTAMMHFMGVEYLGLNSLFASILNVLNMAELGVGLAMVFSMYKPIAEDDAPRICALMRLYRRYYRLIGLVIGVIGILLIPVVPHLVKEELPAGLNLYWLYFLNLGATVLTYWLFAYRNCLLQAHQRLDLSSVITIASSTVQYILQLGVMIWLKNYYLYVLVMILGNIVNNIITAMVTKWKFPQYRPEGQLAKAEIQGINRKIRDLFTGKIGTVILQSADSVVISAFLGITVLAVYQNYYFILSAVLAIIEIIVSSITAGLGNSFQTETQAKNFADMQKFTFMYLWLTGTCACCFLGMYQPFMQIWVGTELMLGNGMVVCLAVYFFMYTLNRLLNTYKDAAGLWHVDRWRPLVTAMVNLGLNLLTVRWLGLYGVVLSTIASWLFVGIPWLLRNLFSKLFDASLLKCFLHMMLRFMLWTASAGSMVAFVCARITLSPWLTLLLCCGISVLIPTIVFFVVYRKDEPFRQAVVFADRLTKGKLQLEKRLVK